MLLARSQPHEQVSKKMGREFTPDEQRRIKQAIARVDTRSGLWFSLIPYRRLVVRQNIHRVFGSFLSAGEELRLVKAYYSHLIKLAWELTVAQHLTNWRKRFVPGILNMSHLTNALDKKKGRCC